MDKGAGVMLLMDNPVIVNSCDIEEDRQKKSDTITWIMCVCVVYA